MARGARCSSPHPDPPRPRDELLRFWRDGHFLDQDGRRNQGPHIANAEVVGEIVSGHGGAWRGASLRLALFYKEAASAERAFCCVISEITENGGTWTNPMRRFG